MLQPSKLNRGPPASLRLKDGHPFEKQANSLSSPSLHPCCTTIFPELVRAHLTVLWKHTTSLGGARGKVVTSGASGNSLPNKASMMGVRLSCMHQSMIRRRWTWPAAA